jgi:NhaA family Na+:H+ antiporter
VPEPERVQNQVSHFRSRLEWFIHSEVTGSILLLACTVVALAWANSPWADTYFHLLHTPVGVSWGTSSFNLSLHHWINDGLMAVFFFVVGLEIKRELVVGELSSLAKAALPVAAAGGGMLGPALFYVAFNVGGAGVNGWGIPMATDIAFALGVLAMFGTRVPLGLKVFLTALAIADDLGAVAVIAIFYTATLSVPALLAAAALLAVLFVAVRIRVRPRGSIYLLIIGVWAAVFASGVHSTVAGILLAMVIPVRPQIDPRQFIDDAIARMSRLLKADVSVRSVLGDREHLSTLELIHARASDALPAGLVLEHALHPVQVWLILPLFALANAGVAIGGDIMTVLGHEVSLGIIAGLVVGKPLGIFVMSWLAVKSGRGALPEGVAWPHLFGAAALAGIGFTMSLFISDLAFDDELLTATAKVGILAASIVSALVGVAVLARWLPKGPPGPRTQL